jgi:hypothetical protein
MSIRSSLPPFFHGGWRTFKFSFDKDLQEENEKCWGKTDFDQGIIHLEDTMDGDILRETILHEITHILLETVGYGDYDDTDETTSLNNEPILFASFPRRKTAKTFTR